MKTYRQHFSETLFLFSRLSTLQEIRKTWFSWYNLQKTLKYIEFRGTFEQFCNNFMNNNGKLCEMIRLNLLS